MSAQPLNEMPIDGCSNLTWAPKLGINMINLEASDKIRY